MLLAICTVLHLLQNTCSLLQNRNPFQREKRDIFKTGFRALCYDDVGS